MYMSYPKLRGAIREKFNTQEAFAAALGMAPVTLNKKLQGHTEWTRPEIQLSATLLGIPKEDIQLYFF